MIETTTVAPEVVFEQSPSINDFASAFIKAQSEMANAKKDSSNPFFNSTYADLASVREACIKPLNDNGICVMQPIFTKIQNGHLFAGIKTMFIHSGGQFLSSTLLVPVKGNGDAQAMASAHTYGRRTSLAALAGIAPADDDGNAASAPEVPSLSKQAQDFRQAAQRLEKVVGFKPEPERAPEDNSDLFGQEEHQAQPPQQNTEGFVLKFGAEKGVHTSQAKTETLKKAVFFLTKSLEKPADKYTAGNVKQLEMVQAEINRRAQ